MRTMLNPRRRGFTLIEILCVVVIVGIASAVILPQLSTRDDMRAASAARTLMADLLYAQNRSIALQKYHYVSFNTAANSYQVMDSPTNVITHPVELAPYVVPFGTGNLSKVKINSASFDGQTIIAFDSLGVPYSYNSGTNTTTALVSGSIVINCGAFNLTVSVKPYSGEVTVQ